MSKAWLNVLIYMCYGKINTANVFFNVDNFIQVCSFLENFDDKSISAIQLIIDYDIYPLLLDCLIYG